MAEILDSTRDSTTIDECRHMVRKRLVDILDALEEIGLNAANKPSERTNALKILVDFAQEASDQNEKRLVSALSPGVARKLARLGVVESQKPQKGDDDADAKRVLPNQAEGRRLGSGEGAGDGGGSEDEGDGGLGPA